MIIKKEISISEFSAWSGGEYTQNRIIQECKEDEFDFLMNSMFPDGLTDTQLNDMLWFEEEWIYDMLGIEED